MMIFWSASSKCFYDSRINSGMPEDAIEISGQLRDQLIVGELSGKVISADQSGWPVLQDPAPPSNDDVISAEREWRDAELQRVSWLRDRHRDQLDLELPLSLQAVSFSELLVYIQALRDWPQSSSFPDSQYRPVAPLWLSSDFQRPRQLLQQSRDQALQLADLKREALAKRDELLREAVQNISPFQYAEDIGDASDQEQSALMEWKRYSVELNRIQHQAGFPIDINWPVMPEPAA